MDGCCDTVQKQLERANQGTRYLLEHAEGLRAERSVGSTATHHLAHWS